MEKRSLSSFFVRSKPKDICDRLQKKKKENKKTTVVNGVSENCRVYGDGLSDDEVINIDGVIENCDIESFTNFATNNSSKANNNENIITKNFKNIATTNNERIATKIITTSISTTNTTNKDEIIILSDSSDSTTNNFIEAPTKRKKSVECQVTLKGDGYLIQYPSNTRENILELYERHCKKTKVAKKVSGDIVFTHNGIKLYNSTKFSSLINDDDDDGDCDIVICIFTQQKWNEMEIQKTKRLDSLLMNDDFISSNSNSVSSSNSISSIDSIATSITYISDKMKISLSFRFKDLDSIELEVDMMDTLEKISFILLKITKKEGCNIKFKLDGDILLPTDSPFSLDLEDSDMIECFLN